jgi:hypothetical protein
VCRYWLAAHSPKNLGVMRFSRTRGISFRNSIVDFAFNRHLSANPQHCQFYHQYCRFCHSAVCVLMQHSEHWRSEDCVPTSRLKMVFDVLSSFKAAKSSCIVDTIASNREVSAPNHHQAKSNDEGLYGIFEKRCIASPFDLVTCPFFPWQKTCND